MKCFLGYQCGSNYGWSEIFSFVSFSSKEDMSLNIAMYGDMGVINPQSLSRYLLD